MRIAMFTDSFYPELGGIQDSILLSSQALGQRGHAVLILAPAAAARDFTRAGVPQREIDLGANVRVQRYAALPAPGSTGQSRLFLPSQRALRDVAAFAPDLIHCHTFLGAGHTARRAARRLGVPLIGTNHWAIGAFAGYVPLPATWVRPLSLRAVSAFYNHCQLVTGPSRSVLADMAQHGLQAPRQVLSNPIDTRLFRPPPDPATRTALQAQFGLNDQTIVYAGRLAREKNVDVLLRAMPLLLRQQPQAILALAGHGSAHAALQALARQLGIANQVRFLGTLDKPTLATLFQAATVFALASTSETQSMVLLQAMASGLPAVAARALALPEYVDADCGRLATPGDAADFAAQLGLLLADNGLANRLGAQARQRSLAYACDAIVTRWEALYTQYAMPQAHLASLTAGAQP